MSFLYPVFLLGALAVAIPVVLHLMRRDVAPEVPFTAVRLLRRAPLEQTRRRRLRELLLLTARVLALLLLAGAFARPYFTGEAAGTQVIVVGIDRSFSMGTPGRFERALALAREAIDAAGRGARVAVVAFDDRAQVLAPPGDAGRAHAALDGLTAGYGSTRFGPLVARAIELSDGAPARLVIVTDMQRVGWQDEERVATPADLQIDLRDAGAVPANAAVVSIRRGPASIVAAVQNAGEEPRSGIARVLLDGREVASAPFTVPAAGTVDVSVPYRAPDRGGLAVQIEDGTGYAADNTRFVALDAADRTRVLIVGAEGDRSGFYVREAIEAAAGSAFEVRTRPARALGRAAPEEVADFRAVVLLSTRALDRQGRDMLAGLIRDGGGLFVAAAPEVEPATVATLTRSAFSATEAAPDRAVLAATELRHPIFHTFGPLAANLGQVRFTRTWRVRAEGWDVAARFTDGSPALLERRTGAGRVAVFASDLDRRWNDFPLHPAFVPFVVEALRHIAPVQEFRSEYLVADAPRGTPAEPGVYAVGAGARRVAVNVDARESTVARLTPEDFRAMLQPVPGTAAAARDRGREGAEGRQNLWRYGLVLMLAALIGESLVGRRG